MKCKEVLKRVSEKTGIRQADISRTRGVSTAAVASAFSAQRIGAESLATYLKAMGYNVYAIPESIHIESIFDDAIRIDPEERGN